MKDGLLAIRTYIIPKTILLDTVSFLQQVGREGFEGFVLWGAVRLEASQIEFRSALIPRQRASQTEHGLLVTVEGQSLFEVNRALYDRGELLGAQVHSHPTDAYHSSTDDQYPMVTLMGALSLVVPDFARNAPGDLDRWACYRLSRRSRWEPIDKRTTLEIR